MAYDKSFAQFQFVVSRSFFEKSRYRVPKWRFLTTPAELSRCLRHHAGARLCPPGPAAARRHADPRRIVAKTLSRSGRRPRLPVEAPSRCVSLWGIHSYSLWSNSLVAACRAVPLCLCVKFHRVHKIKREFFILSYPRFPVCPITR